MANNPNSANNKCNFGFIALVGNNVI